MRRPETYARLLELDHWERAIRNRYAQHERPRGFVTQLQWILADLLGFDHERVQKLRKNLVALKRGRRRSLPISR